jgi:lipopolysaccharide/colanic/teichoic acid biosynthesis glycosyltransferase
MRNRATKNESFARENRERISLTNLPGESVATDKGNTAVMDKPKYASGHHRFPRLLKRTIDVTGSGVLILLLLPVFVVLASLIRLVDGAPVIYRRRVVGHRGGFDAYKFRTMIPEADAMLAADARLRMAFTQQFKLKSDPRVTRLGAWLRKYSFDELPQLFNVLKGQMSLVGPRMITAPELQKYGPYQQLLLTVKPGLTGYWQVRGRQEVSYAERVRMDVYYITHWSLGLDLVILLKTPSRVMLGEGAY